MDRRLGRPEQEPSWENVFHGWIMLQEEYDGGAILHLINVFRGSMEGWRSWWWLSHAPGTWFAFPVQVNQALHPSGIAEPGSGKIKSWLVYRLTTANNCIGQMRTEIVSTTSPKRNKHGASQKEVINVVLYSFTMVGSPHALKNDFDLAKAYASKQHINFAWGPMRESEGKIEWCMWPH